MAAPAVVIPNPRIPSMLGTLNVVFGILLLVSSLIIVGWTIAYPHLMKVSPQQARVQDALKRAAEFDGRLAALEKQRTDAKDGAARAEVQTQIDALLAEHNEDELLLETQQSEQLKLPLLAASFWAEHVLGMLLNALMIAAGVGMLALKGWGRTLAVRIAALKVVKLIAFMGIAVFLTIPLQVMRSREILAKMEAHSGSSSASTGIASMQIAQIQAVTQTMVAVGFGLTGLVYPILTIWLLNKHSARAAFVRPQPLSKGNAAGGPPPDLS